MAARRKKRRRARTRPSARRPAEVRSGRPVPERARRAEPAAEPERSPAAYDAPERAADALQTEASARQKAERRTGERRPSSRRGASRSRGRSRRGAGQNVEPFAFREVKKSRPKRPRKESDGRAGEIIYRSLLALMIAAALFFVVSVFFEVKHVRVTGSDRYLPAYVAQVSGIREGDKLLFLNEFEISQNLFENLPYVKSVKLRRRPPDTVVLEVTERTPVAKLISGDVAYIIDEDACLLDYTVLDEDYDLPVINGAAPSGRDLGKPMEFTDPLMLDSLRSVLSELVKSNWMENITQLSVEKIYSISFSYANRFTVVLGDASNLPYKLSLLEEVLSRLHETDQGVIDLSTPEMARFQPAVL